jgi:hypothetical protein
MATDKHLTNLQNLLNITLIDYKDKKTLSKVELFQHLPIAHHYEYAYDAAVIHHFKLIKTFQCGSALLIPNPVEPFNPRIEMNYQSIHTTSIPAGSKLILIDYLRFAVQSYSLGNNFPVDPIRSVRYLFQQLHEMSKFKYQSQDDPTNSITNSLRESSEWLKKYFSLINYIDLISLIRTKSLKTDPFQVFDETHLKLYQQTFENYVKTNKSNKYLFFNVFNCLFVYMSLKLECLYLCSLNLLHGHL